MADLLHEEALNHKMDESVPTKSLCHLIKLIHPKNAFIFNKTYYLQQQGTAMGTLMAPLYTNLFMVTMNGSSYGTKQCYLLCGGDLLMTFCHLDPW